MCVGCSIRRYTPYGGGRDELVDDVEIQVGRERFGNSDKGLEHILHDGDIRRGCVNGFHVNIPPMDSDFVLLNLVGR